MLQAAVQDLPITDKSRLREDLWLDELGLMEIKESLEGSLGCRLVMSKIHTVEELKRAAGGAKAVADQKKEDVAAMVAAAVAAQKEAERKKREAKEAAAKQEQEAQQQPQEKQEEEKKSPELQKVKIEYGYCVS